jgi:simple sugar transport system permease protein
MPLAAGVVGLVAMGLCLAVLGYDAAAALGALGRGAFGSWYAITSATLVRATPLIVIALGLAVAFRAGALNIGAEGQFYAGATAATWVGVHLGGVPSVVAIPLVLGAGAAAGLAWVAIPVVLRLRFNVLEVISTLLLNFVAEAMVSFMVQGPLQEAKRIYPQSDPIALAARLPQLPGTRLHLGFLLAIGLAVALFVVFGKTIVGFRLRAVGEGPGAAAIAGRIDVPRTIGGALAWSGAFAGLAGALEISGVTYALYQNLSPGYGFTAIAVALIAGLHPLGIIVAGIGFGALEAGAAGMQRDAEVPAVAVYVVQAVIIVLVLLALSRRRLVRAEAET